MNRFLYPCAFGLGLAAVLWVGAGYVTTNPLALTMTLLICAFYAMGALELQRFRQATSTLSQALATIPDRMADLGTWLTPVHPSLRNAVRLRIEGERVALPGPAMTPYLVGLLVLLGMLGTFLGMVVTLNGAVIALESTTDLQAVRASLAAPVKGLGVAFGTSVAGVSASAMLGLMSALCRRDRLQAAHDLDTQSATGALRGHSLARQREEIFQLLQGQARVLPELVDAVRAMMAQMHEQGQGLGERLAHAQDGFHRNAEASYTALAASVGRSLESSMAESARVAGTLIRPVVEATMGGIARETSLLHERMAGAAQRQLDGLSARFDATVARVAEGWDEALARHARTSDELAQGLQRSLAQFSETFEQRAAALLGGVAEAHRELHRELAQASTGSAQETARLHERMAATVQAQLEGVSARFDAAVSQVAGSWREALAQHQRTSEGLSGDTREALAAFADGFERNAASLLERVDQSQGRLQERWTAQDGQRLAAWTESLAAMAESLRQEWQQAGARTLGQQEQICQTWEKTARDIAAQAESHARNTIAEIARLMQAAAEAPRAAADVIGQLREKLSDSLARDNDLLEERSRIMATLDGLLDAVNHAATEQRGAIDTLVGSSAELLERIGARFEGGIEAGAAKIDQAAAQVEVGAIEVASLGEAFGAAVQRFDESNDKLMTHLQRIEGALGKSIARSDEQLDYYVAQAREIIDLSIGSQKQIVEDLQRLSSQQRPAAAAGEAP